MPVANLCGITKISYTNLELTQEFQTEIKKKKKKGCISKIYMVEAKTTKSLGVNSAKKRTQSKEKALN